jgi:hypothetical protein
VEMLAQAANDFSFAMKTLNTSRQINIQPEVTKMKTFFSLRLSIG